MKENLYFALALIDIFLGFAYTLAGHWGFGLMLFGCAYLLSFSITKKEEN